MAMTLITTNTSSDAASSSFTSGIDNTYKLYIFKLRDVNPATDAVDFTFQVNATDSTGYNRTTTNTYFRSYNNESGGGEFNYNGNADQAQGTAFNVLCQNVGNDADQSVAGELFLFNPSNTTYVKHFYSKINSSGSANLSMLNFLGGYINDTTAIDDIQFKFTSGNMDAVISMYGVGD